MATTYQHLLIIIAIVFIALFLLIFLSIGFLIYLQHTEPTMPELHVTDASLSQFDISTTTNTLSYSLSLNMTLPNPNKHFELFYNPIQVRAYYKGKKFAEKEFPAIYPHDKEEEHMSSEFVGQYLIPLQYKDVSQYNSEKRSGIYRIDLEVDTVISSSWGRIRKYLAEQSFDCHLKVPLVFNGNTSSSFVTTKC